MRHSYKSKHRVRTQQFEVAFPTLKLIETDVGFDGDTRARITQVRIAGGHNCEPFALGLPREVSDIVCMSQNLESE